MVEITTYGYKKPEDNDTQFWDYIEFNIERMDGHTHDGTDSALIPSKGITHGTATINSWTAIGNFFRNLVTLPADYSFDNTNLRFYIGNDLIYPTVEKVSSTTFYVYSIANSTTMTVFYG